MGSSNSAILLAMFAFVLMAIIGIINPAIPLTKIIMRAFVAIAIFMFLGKIYSNIGRDLFREAINESKIKRNEQAEATRSMLEGDTGFKSDEENNNDEA